MGAYGCSEAGWLAVGFERAWVVGGMGGRVGQMGWVGLWVGGWGVGGGMGEAGWWVDV